MLITNFKNKQDIFNVVNILRKWGRKYAYHNDYDNYNRLIDAKVKEL